MPNVTFANDLVTTIPPNNSSTGRAGEHKQSEDESLPPQRRRRPSVWRLVLVGILLCGTVVVAIVLWRRNDGASKDDDDGDDAPFYDDGRFRNPETAIWFPVGDDIPVRGRDFLQIQISGDARTLAIVNSTYIQLYQSQETTGWVELAGFETQNVQAIALAGDGRRLAIATREDNRIRFYDNLRAGRWSLRPEFLGAPQNCRLSLDYDGIVLAVGRPAADDSTSESTAQVRIMRYNFGTATWTQEAEILNEAGASQQLQLAADGRTMVDVNTEGQVAAWQRTADETTVIWNREGKALRSDQQGAFFGKALSLSADGNTLAVASPEFDNRGRVQIFEYSRNRWQPRRHPLFGSYVDFSFGSDVCISANGNLVSAVDGDVVRLYQAVGSDSWNVVGVDRRTSEIEQPVWDTLQCSASGRVLAVSSRSAQLVRVVQVVESP